MSDYEPGTVERKLRETAEHLRANPKAFDWSLNDGVDIVVDASDAAPSGEPLDLFSRGPSRSFYSILKNDGRCTNGRAVVNYLADGSRDTSRSHYTVNGRKVTHAEYKRRCY